MTICVGRLPYRAPGSSSLRSPEPALQFPRIRVTIPCLAQVVCVNLDFGHFEPRQSGRMSIDYPRNPAKQRDADRSPNSVCSPTGPIRMGFRPPIKANRLSPLPNNPKNEPYCEKEPPKRIHRTPLSDPSFTSKVPQSFDCPPSASLSLFACFRTVSTARNSSIKSLFFLSSLSISRCRPQILQSACPDKPTCAVSPKSFLIG